MTQAKSNAFAAVALGLSGLLALADGKYLAAFAFAAAVLGQIEAWALRTGRIE